MSCWVLLETRQDGYCLSVGIGVARAGQLSASQGMPEAIPATPQTELALANVSGGHGRRQDDPPNATNRVIVPMSQKGVKALWATCVLRQRVAATRV